MIAAPPVHRILSNTNFYCMCIECLHILIHVSAYSVSKCGIGRYIVGEVGFHEVDLFYR